MRPRAKPEAEVLHCDSARVAMWTIGKTASLADSPGDSLQVLGFHRGIVGETSQELTTVRVVGRYGQMLIEWYPGPSDPFSGAFRLGALWFEVWFDGSKSWLVVVIPGSGVIAVIPRIEA